MSGECNICGVMGCVESNHKEPNVSDFNLHAAYAGLVAKRPELAVIDPNRGRLTAYEFKTVTAWSWVWGDNADADAFDAANAITAKLLEALPKGAYCAPGVCGADTGRYWVGWFITHFRCVPGSECISDSPVESLIRFHLNLKGASRE